MQCCFNTASREKKCKFFKRNPIHFTYKMKNYILPFLVQRSRNVLRQGRRQKRCGLQCNFIARNNLAPLSVSDEYFAFLCEIKTQSCHKVSSQCHRHQKMLHFMSSNNATRSCRSSCVALKDFDNLT